MANTSVAVHSLLCCVVCFSAEDVVNVEAGDDDEAEVQGGRYAPVVAALESKLAALCGNTDFGQGSDRSVSWLYFPCLRFLAYELVRRRRFSLSTCWNWRQWRAHP